jgi:hypothetical protein
MKQKRPADEIYPMQLDNRLHRFRAHRWVPAREIMCNSFRLQYSTT